MLRRKQLKRVGRTSLAAKDSAASGIILFSKEAGPTSFSSLGVIKRALSTGRVGHTGTLDSFAEGLLVVLVGKMTRLVPYITATEKKYLAVVAFGSETDTLEASGQVVRRGNLPSRQAVEEALPQFRGAISQMPPLYSAIHVDGKRASDLVRSGASVQLSPREITIHSLELLDFDGGFGMLEVTCSKGTYIRSLARDLARAAGTCGHLVALRRVGVGPFKLEDAVFASRLQEFTLASRGRGELLGNKAAPEELEAVAGSLIQFTPEMACGCGFVPLVLSNDHYKDFFQGRPPRKSWFSSWKTSSIQEYPVYFETGELVGMIRKAGEKLSYGFVIPQ